MITQCSYCRLNTAGQHEYGCLLRKGISTFTWLLGLYEFVWKDGRRYRLVPDDPPDRVPGLHKGYIHVTLGFDNGIQITEER